MTTVAMLPTSAPATTSAAVRAWPFHSRTRGRRAGAAEGACGAGAVADTFAGPVVVAGTGACADTGVDAGRAAGSGAGCGAAACCCRAARSSSYAVALASSASRTSASAPVAAANSSTATVVGSCLPLRNLSQEERL